MNIAVMPSQDTMKVLLVSLSFFGVVTASFFEVQYPSVVLSAETNGTVTVKAGPQHGNLFLKSSPEGSVFIGKYDVMKMIETLRSMPPVWSENSEHGSLGSFLGGSPLHIIIRAEDPEGGQITYEKISGALPPGITLNRITGLLSGIIPDVDATYEFGIRASDKHGKHADQTFSIDTREKNQCKSNPCQHNSRCIDDISSFRCSCQPGYGGERCQYDCANNPVGVADNLKTIPDAQLSAHYSFQDHAAWNARLNGRNGWIGIDVNSWLQVDFGSVMEWFAVAIQGFPGATYYTTTYNLKYSLNGDTFTSVPDNAHPMLFNGSASYNVVTKQTLPSPVRARFVRFVPKSFGTHPGFRVELYACPL